MLHKPADININENKTPYTVWSFYSNSRKYKCVTLFQRSNSKMQHLPVC